MYQFEIENNSRSCRFFTLGCLVRPRFILLGIGTTGSSASP